MPIRVPAAIAQTIVRAIRMGLLVLEVVPLPDYKRLPQAGKSHEEATKNCHDLLGKQTENWDNTQIL